MRSPWRSLAELSQSGSCAPIAPLGFQGHPGRVGDCGETGELVMVTPRSPTEYTGMSYQSARRNGCSGCLRYQCRSPTPLPAPRRSRLSSAPQRPDCLPELKFAGFGFLHHCRGSILQLVLKCCGSLVETTANATAARFRTRVAQASLHSDFDTSRSRRSQSRGIDDLGPDGIQTKQTGFEPWGKKSHQLIGKDPRHHAALWFASYFRF